MPKGFLVKRSKRTGAVSYRIRDDSVTAQSLPTVSGIPTFHLFMDNVEVSNFAQRKPNRVYFGGMPESYAPSLSPTRPDSLEYSYQYPTDVQPPRSSTISPSLSEILPEPILGSFAVNGSPATPSLPEMASKLDSICKEQARSAAKRPAPTSTKNQTGAKKRKTTSFPNQDRRPVSRDKVTTSPVLGLRIKEDPDEDARKSSSTSCSPLGGFICQLCKESYPDPLSLAHHKCSRIVRVEYRCTECDKVFSCPANLASHRRWHKPRREQGESVSTQPEENKSLPSASSLGMGSRETATPPLHNSDSASDDEMSFSCHLCAKKFRRQAYLRKHLALHNRKASGMQQNQLSPEANVTTQSPSGNVEERDTPDSSIQHPTNEQIVSESDVYRCRFCGDNFFSSPGLTRHINKLHPTENRQVIFLSRMV